jgi:3-hydroxy-5-methyl-1-naphthoate 3-O-methyltransferase
MLTPNPLMHLVAGFWSFKTLAAAVDLGLFTALRGGRTITVAEVTEEFGLAERPTDMLLAACASLGLLEKDGDGYRNSELAETFLVAGQPDYFGGLVAYCDARTYPAWHRIGEALRSDRPLTWDPDKHRSLFETADPQILDLFWEAMHSTSMFTARALSDACDLSGHKRLLDVGGGSGAYAIVLCQRYPHLSATVYDLPHVCDTASRNAAQAGLGDRITAVPGDFLTASALPGEHDVILLSMILHDWAEPTNRELLAKCYAALPSGGTLIVSELILNTERTGPPAAALMGLNMVVETEGGRNYSESEYAAWLRDTGFTDVRRVNFEAPGANGAVVARKP